MTPTIATTVLTHIIQILVSGVTQMATGLGAGIKSIIESVMLTGTTTEGVFTPTGLSVFGAVVVIFAGISLALSLFRLLFSWVAGLGNNRRV